MLKNRYKKNKRVIKNLDNEFEGKTCYDFNSLGELKRNFTFKNYKHLRFSDLFVVIWNDNNALVEKLGEIDR